MCALVVSLRVFNIASHLDTFMEFISQRCVPPFSRVWQLRESVADRPRLRPRSVSLPNVFLSFQASHCLVSSFDLKIPQSSRSCMVKGLERLLASFNLTNPKVVF